jgi:tetratricopeptide (TPR) repeat protein
MSLPQREVQELIRDAHAALQEMSARARLAKAWDLLQERDVDGNAVGALPYTDEALAEFEAARQCEPDDIGVVHHLAIAHHARAWDLELQGDKQASAAWEVALGYWSFLAASREFRSGLEAKLLTCDPNVDPMLIADMLNNLTEMLLDVHVGFINYYCELGEEIRARSHVELIERVKLEAAMKARFVEKVFEAQTSSVPEAKANRSYTSALTTVERFLKLFPDQLSALRMYMEVCAEYLGTLSYKVEENDWPEILRVAACVEPYARRLEVHAQLDDEPLAKSALEALATKIAFHASDRGDSYLAGDASQPITLEERDGIRSAFELSIKWCRLCYRHSPDDGALKSLLSYGLECHAFTQVVEAKEVLAAQLDLKTGLTVAMRLYRKAIAELEEAAALRPDNDKLKARLNAWRDDLTELDSQQCLVDLFKDMKGKP